MVSLILTALYLAGAGLDSRAVGKRPADGKPEIRAALPVAKDGPAAGAAARGERAPDSTGTAPAKGSGAAVAEEVSPEERRVVVRFRTVPPGGGERPSAWSGTGRTWAWVGAAGLGVAGAVIGYHYLVDGEVPRDKVISLTD